MHQRVPGEVVVQKRRDCANPLYSPPENQILWTIPTIQCHNFASLDAQILHQPVAHTSHQLEELAIRVAPALKREELLIRSLVQRLVTQDVEVGQAFLRHGLGEEATGGYAVEDEAEVV
jgi:hypothetical protein